MVIQSSPPEIVYIADDDDISILYSWSNNKKKGTNKANPISVENYSNAIEDIRNKARTFIDLSANAKHPNGKRPLLRGGGISIFEPGQSSRNVKDNDKDDGTVHDDVIATVFVCEICVDYKEMSESFRIKGCSHSYCNECIHKYVDSKIQENVSQIRCPVSGCVGLLEPEYCRSILPAEVFDRWGYALCEALILACNEFYCPYKDCSALMIMDDGDESGIVESECPVCRRLFCAKCKVAWHAGVECGEFQKLHKDEREREDIMLMQLAKDKKWIRCSQCKFYVEKSQGCLFMKCRCGYTFCYNCGSPLTDHYCTKCDEEENDDILLDE